MTESDLNRLFFILFAFVAAIFALLYRWARGAHGARSTAGGTGGGACAAVVGGSGDGGARDGNWDGGLDGDAWRGRLYILIGLAVFARLAFAAAIEGFPYDIACFKSWSAIAASNLFGIYDTPELFIDYPPGYLYVLAAIGRIGRALGIGSASGAYTALVKLPAILADAASGYVLYQLAGWARAGASAGGARLANWRAPAGKAAGGGASADGRSAHGGGAGGGGAPGALRSAAARHAGERAGRAQAGAAAPGLEAPAWEMPGRERLLVSALYLFNPLVFFISTIWGQIDSILALLLLLSLLCCSRRQYARSGALVAAAVLVKPQGLMAAPVLAAAALCGLIFRRDWRPAAKMAAGAAGAIAAVALPFSIGRKPLWIAELYAGTLGGYKFASVNSFNFFALVGANWKDDSGRFLGMTYAAWGLAAIVLFSLAAMLAVCARHFMAASGAVAGLQPLLMAAAMLIACSVTFGHRMHERYIFPALLLLLAEYRLEGRRFSLIAYCGLSFSGFMNTLLVFSSYYSHPDDVSTFYGNGLIYVISAMNVAVAIAIFAWALARSRLGALLRGLAKPAALAAVALLVAAGGIGGAGAMRADASAAAAAVAVANPGFEAPAISDGIPGWAVYDYRRDYESRAGVSEVSIDTEIHAGGSASLRIGSASPNDVRVYQRIAVEPDSVYRVSCLAMADSVGGDGLGANISVMRLLAASEDFRGTSGGFAPIVMYGRTGDGQESLDISFGLGGYGSENSGTAWFDDIAVEKLPGTPPGTVIHQFYDDGADGANVGGDAGDADDAAGGGAAGEERPGAVPAGLRLMAIAIALCALAAVVLMAFKSPDSLRWRRQREGAGSGGVPEGAPSGIPSGVPSAVPGGEATAKSGGGAGAAFGGEESGAAGGRERAASDGAGSAARGGRAGGKHGGEAKPGSRGLAVLRNPDFLIASALTAAYAIIALVRLGGFSAPQTFWKSAEAGDSVVFDFGGPVEIGRIAYSCNTVQFHEDGSYYEIEAFRLGGGDDGNGGNGGNDGGISDSGNSGGSVYAGIGGDDDGGGGNGGNGGNVSISDSANSGGSGDADNGGGIRGGGNS
ncbi:MAG: glycosyltransferase 87 family protein, partial [Clostridiales bacterium]|nr:glycosyltransferase 87 family protein [Clostridiales bacterium]